MTALLPNLPPPRIARVGLAALLLATGTASAQMRGAIERVGLAGGGLNLVREGSWCTIDVQLGNDGTSTFEGTLRVDQFDRDRDVAVATLPVAMPGGQSRPYRVYFLPSSVRSGEQVRVRLFDEKGNLVPVRDANGQPHNAMFSNQVEIMAAGETLVVDLSNARLAQAVLSWRAGFEFYQNRAVRAISAEPRALPDRWHGLEGADAIVWDDADASTVDADQLAALADWVRNGGRLLVTCAAGWQSVAASKLAPILPVKISGVVQTTRGEAVALLPLSFPNEETIPDAAATITRCRISPQGLAGETETLGVKKDDALAYRRRVGRGNVVFIGATFKELFSPLVAMAKQQPDDETGDAPRPAALMSDKYLPHMQRFLRGLLSIPDPARTSDKTMALTSLDPYDAITRRVSFQQRAGLYLLFSILFAASYFLIATLGTWFWLGRKNLRHHAWSAFTVVAIVAALGGIGAVTLLHGFRLRVHDVQVVDARANLPDARATCLFGLRTPDHDTVSLRLPAESSSETASAGGGLIAALPPITGFGREVTGYVAPATYALEQNGREINHVAVRATLKEFTGHWEGNLDGRVDARLVMRQRDVLGRQVPYYGEGSFLRNNLNVDLTDCYLLDTSQEFIRYAWEIRCFSVGTLKKGEERRDFSAWFLKKVASDAAAAAADALGDSEAFAAASDLPSLNKSLNAWGRNLQSIFRQSQDAPATLDHVALLALGAYDVYRPEDHTDISPLERSGGRRFGCVHQIGPRHALLVGFADSAGPARLEVDREKLPGSYSVTMYRILIPVERE